MQNHKMIRSLLGFYVGSMTYSFGGASATSVAITVDTRGPEIVIEQPKGSSLSTNGRVKVFGAVKVGKKGAPKVFSLKNNGSADLSKLKITTNGPAAGDFVIVSTTRKVVKAAETVTFTVYFKPGRSGERKAVLNISSNDPDENPFRIQLRGNGSR